MNNFPQILKEKYYDYTIIKDTEGWSPAQVYKLEKNSDVLFLKQSNAIFNRTTYNVKREKDIIEWLSQRLGTPEIIHYEESKEFNSLLMTHVGGISLENYKSTITIEEYIDFYIEIIKQIHSISIDQCPHNNCIDNRLYELKYLINNDLADIDSNNWEKETRNRFKTCHDLFDYINTNKPEENLIFSHGDITNSNIFIEHNQIKIIDLGRCGLADKWLDIAFCVREIKEASNDNKWIGLFFEKLQLKPDWDKIDYYILLDELF